MKHIEPFGLFEARDTWERAGDKEWVKLRRSGVPDIPFGDEAGDYFRIYEPNDITKDDLIELKSIIGQFNKPYTDKETKFEFNYPDEQSLKNSFVSTYIYFGGSYPTWSCEFWFYKRTFAYEDLWIINITRPKIHPIEWNNDTLIYTSDYILCNGIRGIREFFKSYTGEFKNKFSLK